MISYFVRYRGSAADPAAFEVDERLVVQLEFAIGKRAAYIPFKVAAGVHELIIDEFSRNSICNNAFVCQTNYSGNLMWLDSMKLARQTALFDPIWDGAMKILGLFVLLTKGT